MWRPARVAKRRDRIELLALAFRDLAVEESTTSGIPGDLKFMLQAVVVEVGSADATTLVIPGHLVLTKPVRIPATVPDQQGKLIAFEASQSIPFPLEEVFWSYQILGEQAGELEVLLVAAKSDAVRALVEVAGSAGVQVSRVIPAGVALRGLDQTPGEADLIVSIGARATHLLFRSPSMLQLRTLTLAGQGITRAVADKLDQSFAEAEQLKIGVCSGAVTLPTDTPAGTAVASATDNFIARLQLEINRSLVTQVRQLGAESPRVLKLVGGGSGIPGLSEALQSKWDGTVEALDVVRDWDIKSTLQIAIDKMNVARLADVLGAAQLTVDTTSTVNLAPPELREAREAQQRKPRRLLAAALLIGALLMPGVHYHRLAGAREAATADMARRLVPVQSRQHDIEQSLEELDHLQAEAQVLARRVKARHAWEGLLVDFQTSLTAVGDVWLEGLQVLPPIESANLVAQGRASPGNDESGAPKPAVRLRLSGRLLDRENPLSRVSQSAFERATMLLNQLVESPQVMEVEGERFDASQPGILRFDFTLVINPTTQI